MGNAVEDVEEGVGDVAAAVTGNAEFIPLINAGITGANDIASGDSIGKSLGQAALSGGEALVGQEAAGAVGVGEGNSAFNSALGITGDTPVGTGLPNIGGAASSALGNVENTLGISGGGNAGTFDTTNAAGAAINPSSGATVSAPSSPTSISPVSGGGAVGAGSVGDVGANQINAQISDLGNVGNDLPSAQTTASPNLGSATGASSDSSLTAAGNAGTYGQPTPSATGATGAADNFASGVGTPAANVTSPTLGQVPPSAAANATGSVTSGAAGATGSQGFLSKLESSAGNAVIPAAALGYEAIKGPSQLPGSATALQPGGAATAPLLGLENQGANEAKTGQLTAPQQGQIQQFVQQQQNQILQQLASEGVQNPTQDSRYISAMNSLQQQVVAMQQQFITQAIQEATSAGGAASQNIATAANEQIANDTAYQQALAAAFGGLGQAVGGGVNLGSLVNKPAA